MPNPQVRQFGRCTTGAPLLLRKGKVNLLPRLPSLEGSTPRPGRRVAFLTMGHHHKPFGSAGTARGLRALDPVGAKSERSTRVARRAPWGFGVFAVLARLSCLVPPVLCGGVSPIRPGKVWCSRTDDRDVFADGARTHKLLRRARKHGHRAPRGGGGAVCSGDKHGPTQVEELRGPRPSA